MAQKLKSLTIAGTKFDIPVLQKIKIGNVQSYARLTPGQNLLQWFQTNAAILNELSYGNNLLYEYDGSNYSLITTDYSSIYFPFIVIATYLGIRETVLPQEGEATDANPLWENGLNVYNSNNYERIYNVQEILQMDVQDDDDGISLRAFKVDNPQQTVEEFLTSIVNTTQSYKYVKFKVFAMTTKV